MYLGPLGVLCRLRRNDTAHASLSLYPYINMCMHFEIDIGCIKHVPGPPWRSV